MPAQDKKLVWSDGKQQKRYACREPTCNQTFSTSGHLSRHMKIHTGEKNHACPIQGCDSKFARRDNMMQHFNAHKKKLAMKNQPVILTSSPFQQKRYAPTSPKMPSLAIMTDFPVKGDMYDPNTPFSARMPDEYMFSPPANGDRRFSFSRTASAPVYSSNGIRDDQRFFNRPSPILTNQFPSMPFPDLSETARYASPTYPSSLSSTFDRPYSAISPASQDLPHYNTPVYPNFQYTPFTHQRVDQDYTKL